MTSPTAVDSSVTHRLLMMAVRYTSWWAMVPNCARLKCPFSEKAFTNMLTSGIHSNSSTISPRGHQQQAAAAGAFDLLQHSKLLPSAHQGDDLFLPAGGDLGAGGGHGIVVGQGDGVGVLLVRDHLGGKFSR